MVTNWNIGRRIIEQEQMGKNRAAYGDRLVELISEDLTRKFGEGYGKRNVQYFRKFYLLFNDFEIVNTCVRNLNWSHFKRLLPGRCKFLSVKSKEPEILRFWAL